MVRTPSPLREGQPMNTARLLILTTLQVAVISYACSGDHLGGAPQSAGSPGALLSGDWGGPHAALSAAADGATLQFDCGRGSITVPVQLDAQGRFDVAGEYVTQPGGRSEEHTSELQSLAYLVCRLLLEKKKKTQKHNTARTTG